MQLLHICDKVSDRDMEFAIGKTFTLHRLPNRSYPQKGLDTKFVDSYPNKCRYGLIIYMDISRISESVHFSKLSISYSIRN